MKATIDGTVAEIADFFSKRSEVMALKEDLMRGLATLQTENAESRQRQQAMIAALTAMRDQNAAMGQNITDLQAKLVDMQNQLGDAIPQEAMDLIAQMKADSDAQQAEVDAVLNPQQGGGGQDTGTGGNDTGTGGDDTQPGGEGEQPQA